MSAKCIKEMMARAKKMKVELTEREAAEIFRNIQKSQVQGDKNLFSNEAMSGTNPKGRIVDYARKAFDKSVLDKEEVLRRKYLQVQKDSGIRGNIENAPAGKRMKALNNEVFKLDIRKNSIESQDLADMSDALESYRKALGYKITKAEGRDVVRELGKPGSTDSAAAAKLADAWRKVTNNARTRLNAAGADIGQLKDWIMPQAWDIRRMKKADSVQFVDDSMNYIDRSRYYDAETGKQMNDAQIREVVAEYFETITTDGLNQPLDAATGLRQRGALGKRLGDEHRAMHFKDADAWYAMTEKYGEYDIFSLMTTTIQKNARNLSMLEGFGPNPHIAFESALALATHLDRSPKGSWMAKNYFAELTGENNIPVNQMFADIMQGLRQWLVATKLGSMLLSQTNDAAVYTVMARANGMGMTPALKLMMKSLNPANKADRLEAQRQSVASTVITNDVAMRYGETTKGSRLTSRGASATVRLSGGDWWTNSLKRGAQSLMTTHLSGFSKLDFAKLEPDFRKMLERYDIDAKTWDLIRKSKAVNLYGVDAITPTAVKLMGDTPAIREASLKVSDMLVTEADVFVPTPGLKERALVKAGTKPGSISGEFMRSIALFKTFSITMGTKVIPRLFNKETLKSKKGAGLAAQFAVSMMVMGGVAYQMKEIAKGNDPIDMTTPSFWGKAFAQSGGAGIFGDFLTVDSNRFGGGLASTLGGPVSGFVEDAAKLTLGNLKKGAQGKETRFGADAIRMAGHNIPVVNLWYTKAAINHFLLQTAQDAVNPGYSRRIRSRTRNTKNQGQWWPTGQMLPERAPKLSDVKGGRR